MRNILHARVRAHLRRQLEQQDHPQGAAFNEAAPLECSWVANSSWKKHHRLELETDLIGAYVLATRAVPTAQFVG